MGVADSTSFEAFLTTFLALLTAHLIADFLAQPTWFIKRKQARDSRLWGIALHVLVVSVILLAFTLPASPSGWRVTGLIILITAIAHFLTDWLKESWLGWRRKAYANPKAPGLEGQRALAFALDQAAHLFVAFVLAVLFAGHASPVALRFMGLPPEILGDVQYFQILAVISAYIAGIPMGGYLIAMATDSLAPGAGGDVARADEGLRGGGKIIGWLERALVIGLVLSQSLSAIGFIIAAKSILRFGDIGPRSDPDSTNRHDVEYIIIGTFMSFGWALLIGAAAKSAIHVLSAAA